MSLLQSSSQFSLQDFLQFPEISPPREYFNGKIYQKPRMRGRQERVLNRLFVAINQTGKKQKTAYAFTNLRCTFGNQYSLVPDIAVFNWNNLPVDSQGNLKLNQELIPNWVIEFLSPEENSTHALSNILTCLQQGSQLGWLIDAQEKRVISFPKGEQPTMHQGDQPLPILRGLKTLQLSPCDLFPSSSSIR
ncbi:Uma2 family endonuclease [Euhalothece natronophila Z-M001]|uniref:Uma2 family endonuclease n=1 Tax=Euhalothece natronophila Z-M001 TaxID=522448 RepID=A0A5B8NJR9_9CHRO|nr:Uma2 family endonuclease [Euhalothece natronophila]QDZ39168.1 Uma2 family endonuclease [Euhalothece natronophila Z-M001]